MRHFAHLNDTERAEMFAQAPGKLSANVDRATLGMALGATLYSPGTRAGLPEAAARAGAMGTTSMVWCLEDAVAHAEVPSAEANVVTALREVHARQQAERAFGHLSRTTSEVVPWPLLFIRVRDAAQIFRIAAAAEEALGALCGFSLPKVTPASGAAMLEAIAELNAVRARIQPPVQPLYGMPILETEDLAWIETRRPVLEQLRGVFEAYAEQVLCVRVGGTDISGLFGLRRDSDTTVWDVGVVRDVLVDVINFFGRRGEHVVTGVVWEHIGGVRLLKPQLRQSPFAERNHNALRQAMIASDVDALMREVVLDRANGLHGKTVIHPSHVAVVNAMLCVSGEEHDDAVAITATAERGGVVASAHGRMNEIGPHALWAQMILRRAHVYGVLADAQSLVRLLAAGQRAYWEAYPAAVPKSAAAGSGEWSGALRA